MNTNESILNKMDEKKRNDYLNSVIIDIILEIVRAERIHPGWPINTFEALAIITEEHGSISKAIQKYKYNSESLANIDKETIHTAAMCIRFLINFREQLIRTGTINV